MLSTSYCKDCKKQIAFVLTERGKYMPCDVNMVPYNSNPDGPSQVLTRGGKLIRCDLVGDAEPCEAFGYIPHFKTCRVKAGMARTNGGNSNGD